MLIFEKTTDEELDRLYRATLEREHDEALARVNFGYYRRMIHPHMVWGWFLQEVAEAFQKFYEDLMAGKRPKLALMTPPQHGKSFTVEDFVSWVAGKNPDLKTIFASYSDDLGVRANTGIQRTMQSDVYRKIFYRMIIGDPGWTCNSGLIEYCQHRGSFRNTTVNGQVTGLALDLGIIDDPVKGRAEVTGQGQRDKVWNWFTDDFMFRFADRAGLIVTMTRWHMDDMLGRAFERMQGWKVLRYPAIAMQDEKHRRKGEALFPEFKSRDFLLERQHSMTTASWEAEAQQNPIVIGGETFPVERFKVVSSFDRSKIKRSVRYVDKAGTQGGGAYTAAALVHDMDDNTTVVEDMIRGQWSALEREQRLLQVAEQDQVTCPRYQIWFEQEPGSGGKESAEFSIRRFKRFSAHADRVTGDKEVRAQPYAAQVQAGQVMLKAAEWNRNFIDEHEQFPNGKFKDQVDSTAGAYNKLAENKSSYDRTLSWVG